MSLLTAVPLLGLPSARATEPIKLDFSEPLTGEHTSTGRMILVAVKIWAEEVNAKSGLLRRPSY